MSPKTEKKREAGFTLVELLVVVAILGIVTMAIHSLYLSTQRSANTTEEVSDVQQNILVGLDLMPRDIRNYGFLLPVEQQAVSGAPYLLCRDLNADGDCTDAGELFSLILQTAAPLGKVARVSTGFTSAEVVTTDHVINVTAADMVDLFDSGAASGDFVRIFRPGNSDPVQNLIYRVVGKNRGGPTLTLRGFSAKTEFLAGDLIVGIPVSGGPYPAGSFPALIDGPSVSSITYTLEADTDSTDQNMRQLSRQINSGVAQKLANKINDIEISYIMQDGTVRTFDPGDPTNPGPTGEDRLDIVAVRLNVMGATDATRTGQPGTSGVKSRGIETTIKIRNR
jgi:prepilin-type N-terminal cleavage/methylation domain-containing protein